MLTDAQRDEGWVKHDGGPCPIDRLTPVLILLRGGEETYWYMAGSVVWQYGAPIWEAGGTPLPESAEVIAYKPDAGSQS